MGASSSTSGMTKSVSLTSAIDPSLAAIFNNYL
jgi:hypothetical protein